MERPVEVVARVDRDGDDSTVAVVHQGNAQSDIRLLIGFARSFQSDVEGCQLAYYLKY
jgi:hypothetical protein